MPDENDSPSKAIRAVNALASGAHVAMTLARRGLLVPGRPDRLAGQLSALARWGLGLAGGFGSAARRSPQAPAVIDSTGTLDFATLDEHAGRLATVLAARLDVPGERLGVLCRNHADLVVALVAGSKLGVDTVLLNTGLSVAQLHNTLMRQRITLLLRDPEFADVDDGAACPIIDTGPDAGSTGLTGLIAGQSNSRHRPPASPGRTIVLTSGTTGQPRGARRPAPGLRSLTSVLATIPLRVGDRTLVAAPLFHTWGYAAMQLCMGMRAPMVLRAGFDPEDTLRLLAEHRCTAMFAVPIMLQRLLELPEEVRSRYDTSALRVVAVSGSGLPGDLAVRFMDAFGEVLYNLYGTTEVSWASIATPAQLRRRPDTAGKPPHGTGIAILDQAGKPVAGSQTGRIHVRNEMLFDGYTDGSQRQRVAGAMDTGDLGHRDDAGLLFVDGRADDMIVSGGENVFPGEVENELAGLDAVAEVAVIAMADAEFGQRLAAYVVRRPGAELDAEAVRDHVRARLARFCVPREVHFLTALPRNATGKVVPRMLTPPD